MNKKGIALVVGGVATLIGGCVVAVLCKREKDRERKIEQELDSAFGFDSGLGSFSCCDCNCKKHKGGLNDWGCDAWDTGFLGSYGGNGFEEYMAGFGEDKNFEDSLFEDDDEEDDDYFDYPEEDEEYFEDNLNTATYDEYEELEKWNEE